MTATTIAVSASLDNLALGCSGTQANLTWPLTHNPLPSGARPNAVRIDNINGTTGVFVRIAPSAGNIVVPGSTTIGNCLYVAPNSNITVELFSSGGSAGTSAFNGGSGNCVVSGITLGGSAIIVVSPVGA